jgi:hypothetical protein
MSRFEGPRGIVTNGLVLNLDAGDPDSYTRSQPPYVEVLVVAGGGGGGQDGAGGGGAGGLIYNSAYQITNAAAITVTVGGGGAGTLANPGQASDGSNSVFGSLTAVGGGGGGSKTSNGRNGGSGGGSGHNAAGPNSQLGGTGTAGQGFNGGNNNEFAGGGGGGASQPGANPSSTTPGNGGNGNVFAISGTSTYYAGGGGGGGYSSAVTSSGGLGGGGNGGGWLSAGAPSAEGKNGTANTGGGGGSNGNAGNSTVTGTGGSGIVIVRYPGLPAATGGTITYLNGYTIHTFTSSGTFTPNKWNDTSGNGNNATLTNGPTFNPYQWGGYIDFDGTDDYATSPASSNFAFGTGNFTLECWVYPINFSNTYPHMIALPDQGTFALKAEVNTGNIYFYSPSWNTYGSTSGWTLTLNTWNHVMFTRVSNVGYAYLNGVSKGSVSGFNNSFSSQVLNIHNGWPGEFERMLMGAVRIYNIGLSSSQVLQNYNAQKSRFGI